MPTQTEEQRQATFQAAGMQPAAAPTQPAPSISSPTVPTATTPTTTATATPPAPTAPLTMPTTGSIIDLLNMAGVDSSYANRQQLANQFGIQGYTGTAEQNIDLSKKYLDAYNAKKGTEVPQTNADARTSMDQYFKDSPQQADPQKTFFDQYMTMNPVIKNLYDQVNQSISTPMVKNTFQQEFAKLQMEQGIPALKTELMNIKKIMDGTEDDIRNEIARAGGFATESQIQALSGARNKTFLKQAHDLQMQIALKDDYVDQLMRFSEMDRSAVEKEVDRKLGLTEKMASLQEKMQNAARDNYQDIVKIMGYNGLALAVKGDKSAARFAEMSLGLPKGALSNTEFLALENTAEWSDPYLLGGDYVQKNSKTGEIRTAVNVAAGKGGKDGMSLASGFPDLNDPQYFEKLMASTSGRKLPNQVETLRPIQKSIAVINQLEGLQKSIDKTTTDPIIGKLRKYNPYDFDARAIQAQLQATVPNLARGVYGEVGVLTDNDIRNYIQTLPNMTSTKQQNDFVMAMTLRTVQRNLESQLETLASAGYDISGFQNQYKKVTDTTREMEQRLGIGSAKPGTRTGKLKDGTTVTKNADGTITDAKGNLYSKDGKRISSPLQWNALMLKK